MNTLLSSVVAALVGAASNFADSVGASLASGFQAIVTGFMPKERVILLDVKKTYMDTYSAKKAAGASEIEAIEQGFTAGANTFANEEGAFMKDECMAVLTLVKSSLMSAAGLKTA